MQPNLHKVSWSNNLTLQWASEFHRSPTYRVLQHGILDEPMDQSGSAIHTYTITLYSLFTKRECSKSHHKSGKPCTQSRVMFRFAR